MAMFFFFQFQHLAKQWLIDDSEYHFILDMPAKQARSPSNGRLTGIIFLRFSVERRQARSDAKCESSARRREVRVKREAARRKTRAKPLITSSCQQTREDKLLEANIRSFSALLKLTPLVCALSWWLHFESEFCLSRIPFVDWEIFFRARIFLTVEDFFFCQSRIVLSIELVSGRFRAKIWSQGTLRGTKENGGL